MSHNFTLTDEQEMVLETVRKFATEEAAPQALDHDEHGRFVRPQLDQLAELGMAGIAVPEDAGGAGLGAVAAVIALEEIAAACGSTAFLLAQHGCVCGPALVGLDAAKELLEAAAAGSTWLAWVGPEHGVRAQADGDGLRLAGAATPVFGGGELDALLVAVALTGGEAALVVVERGEGERLPALALGFHAAAPSLVTLDGVTVPAARVLARGEAARAALARARTGAAIAAAAMACGMARASIEATQRHAGERIAFGKPLLAQQAVAHKLVEMRRAHQRARHLTWHAARLLDAGADAAAAAAMARVDAAEAVVLCADEAIQIHGGYGYVVEYHVERHYRDGKMLEVLDGGAESLRDALAEATAG